MEKNVGSHIYVHVQHFNSILSFPWQFFLWTIVDVYTLWEGGGGEEGGWKGVCFVLYFQEVLLDTRYIHTFSIIKEKIYAIFSKIKLFTRVGNPLNKIGKYWIPQKQNRKILDFDVFSRKCNVKFNILLCYEMRKALPSDWLSEIELFYITSTVKMSETH